MDTVGNRISTTFQGATNGLVNAANTGTSALGSTLGAVGQVANAGAAAVGSTLGAVGHVANVGTQSVSSLMQTAQNATKTAEERFMTVEPSDPNQVPNLLQKYRLENTNAQNCRSGTDTDFQLILKEMEQDLEIKLDNLRYQLNQRNTHGHNYNIQNLIKARTDACRAKRKYLQTIQTCANIPPANLAFLKGYECGLTAESMTRSSTPSSSTHSTSSWLSSSSSSSSSSNSRRRGGRRSRRRRSGRRRRSSVGGEPKHTFRLNYFFRSLPNHILKQNGIHLVEFAFDKESAQQANISPFAVKQENQYGELISSCSTWYDDGIRPINRLLRQYYEVFDAKEVLAKYECVRRDLEKKEGIRIGENTNILGSSISKERYSSSVPSTGEEQTDQVPMFHVIAALTASNALVVYVVDESACQHSTVSDMGSVPPMYHHKFTLSPAFLEAAKFEIKLWNNKFIDIPDHGFQVITGQLAKTKKRLIPTWSDLTHPQTKKVMHTHELQDEIRAFL
jgi:hypothetical protein